LIPVIHRGRITNFYVTNYRRILFFYLLTIHKKFSFSDLFQIYRSIFVIESNCSAQLLSRLLDVFARGFTVLTYRKGSSHSLVSRMQYLKQAVLLHYSECRLGKVKCELWFMKRCVYSRDLPVASSELFRQFGLITFDKCPMITRCMS